MPQLARRDVSRLRAQDRPEPATDYSTAALLAAADAQAGAMPRWSRAIDDAVAVCETNIANADTTAYRAASVTVAADGTARLTRESTQGDLESTSRELDLAIQGVGFFKVRVNDRTGSFFAYTRNRTLTSLGDGLYAESDESRRATQSKLGEDGAGIVVQGILEASNVNLARERVRIRSLEDWREAVIRAMDAKRARR